MAGDIFENSILCNECGKKMKPIIINKNGFNLRAVKCLDCNQVIVHPVDKNEYDNFMRLKEKEFNVKMRMVGNSYAVSIPREIVDFMKESENMLNNMVKLSFQEAGRLNLCFNTPEMQEQNNQNNTHSRVVSSKEIKIVRNGKPVLHARKFSDSSHPERNQTKVFRAEKEINEKEQENFEEEEH